jgi:hypothetical protein
MPSPSPSILTPGQWAKNIWPLHTTSSENNRFVRRKKTFRSRPLKVGLFRKTVPPEFQLKVKETRLEPNYSSTAEFQVQPGQRIPKSPAAASRCATYVNVQSKPKLSGAAPHHCIRRALRQTGHFIHGASAQTHVRWTTGICSNAPPCVSANPAQWLSNVQEHPQEAESLLACAD